MSHTTTNTAKDRARTFIWNEETSCGPAPDHASVCRRLKFFQYFKTEVVKHVSSHSCHLRKTTKKRSKTCVTPAHLGGKGGKLESLLAAGNKSMESSYRTPVARQEAHSYSSGSSSDPTNSAVSSTSSSASEGAISFILNSLNLMNSAFLLYFTF